MMSSCIFPGKIKGNFCSLIINDFHVKISKNLSAFLAYHFPRVTNLPGFKILTRFVNVLCFSSRCVKFQPTEYNISINFDHFSSLFNYVRGVKWPASLFLLGPEDMVQCAWCYGKLQGWEQGDNPFIEHARHFPSCPKFGNHKTANASSFIKVHHTQGRAK